jgi:MFS family permease
MLIEAPPDIFTRALAGAAAGAASGVVIFLLAWYFKDVKRGLLLWALSVLLGTLLGFMAAAIFVAVAAGSYVHPNGRAKRKAQLEADRAP